MERVDTIINFPGIAVAGQPKDVFGFHEDFHEVGTLATSATVIGGWTATHVGTAGTDTGMVLLAEIGGGLIMDVRGTSADNDGVNLNKDGAMFEADTGTTIIFEAKFRIDGCGSSPSMNWLVGLCAPAQTAFLAADAALADVCNTCFLCSADGFAQIDANSTRVAGVTDTRDTAVGTLVDDTFMTFGIIIKNRSKIEFYLDGVLVSSSVANDAIPDGTLTPVIANKTADANTTKPSMEIKYIDCWQTFKEAT